MATSKTARRRKRIMKKQQPNTDGLMWRIVMSILARFFGHIFGAAVIYFGFGNMAMEFFQYVLILMGLLTTSLICIALQFHYAMEFAKLVRPIEEKKKIV